jgi:hypothetical protein
MEEAIQVRGLTEFVRSLRKINTDLPRELRVALNVGANLVVDWAQPRVAHKSGKAARSVRASSTRTAARVTGGGARVPYYPWLDFGGRVGRKRSVHRAFLPGGRYIYPGYVARQDEVTDEVTRALVEVAQRAGFDVGRE